MNVSELCEQYRGRLLSDKDGNYFIILKDTHYTMFKYDSMTASYKKIYNIDTTRNYDFSKLYVTDSQGRKTRMVEVPLIPGALYKDCTGSLWILIEEGVDCYTLVYQNAWPQSGCMRISKIDMQNRFEQLDMKLVKESVFNETI